MVTPIADTALEAHLRARLDSLTKPPGSLGRLEDLAVQVGLIQRSAEPAITSKAMAIFCTDHGVAEEGVSAYPQEVTAQMLANFQAGGAAINVLCRQYGIEPRIVALQVGQPTGNIARKPAMSRQEATAAFKLGRAQAAADVIGAGEMGIGNSTVAAALLCAFANVPVEEAVGSGTGVSAAGLERKRAVVRQALELHRPDPSDPWGVLAAVGGREIAAIAGLIVGAAERRSVVVLDGFICCAAALVVRALEPAALDYVVYSHCSAERGHRAMLAALGARPLLDLGMRLGEGTGAALGIGLVESAVRLYREMATFASAGVSQAQQRAGRD